MQSQHNRLQSMPRKQVLIGYNYFRNMNKIGTNCITKVFELTMVTLQTPQQ
jgi:hypothetical protein